MKQDSIKSWEKKKDVLTLICEWDNCLNVYEDLAIFFSHVTDHICDKDTSPDNGENKNTIYKCLWRNCTIEENSFSSLLNLLNHVNFHAYHQKLKSIGATLVIKNCLNKCTLDGLNRNALPDPIDILRCEWKTCMESILNPENFFNHVDDHIDEYPGGNKLKDGCKCHWKYCSVAVKNKYRLRDHLRTHTHEKFCACPTCGTFFSNATKFIDHIKRQADSQTMSYQCSHCDKKFPTKRILKNHMGQHIYKYRCPFCNISCISPSTLRLHIRYKHLEDRPHQCPDCDHKSKTAIDLRRHSEIHKDSFIFCEYKGCLFKTRFLWQLTLHIKNTHQNVEKCKYVCDECGRKYRNGSNLTQHLKKKHDVTLSEGHSRFTYRLNSDGLYHLQTIRYETIKIMEQDIDKNSTYEWTSGQESEASDENEHRSELNKNLVTRTPLHDHNSSLQINSTSDMSNFSFKKRKAKHLTSKVNVANNDKPKCNNDSTIMSDFESNPTVFYQRCYSSDNDNCLVFTDSNCTFNFQSDCNISIINSINDVPNFEKNLNSNSENLKDENVLNQKLDDYNLLQL